MKGVLTFSLPEEEVEFRLAQDGAKWSLVVHETLQELRRIIKYTDQETVNCEDFRKFIWDLMDNYNLKDE